MTKALLIFAILAISAFAFKIPAYSNVKDCASASLILVHAIQQFQADMKNGTYNTYQLSQEVVAIIGDMQAFFDKCNIPKTDVQVPTYSDPAMCITDMYTLAQQSTELLLDIKDRNYTQIYTDSQSLYQLALQTQSDCQGQLQSEQLLQQQQKHFWDIQLPFNYTNCINSAEKYYYMLKDYQNILHSGQDIMIINATFKVWDYIYTILPICGLNFVEDQISKQAPQKCEINLYNAFNYGYSCYQLKTQPIKYAKCMPKATYLSTVAKQSCPFLNNQTNSTTTLHEQAPLTSMEDLKEKIQEKFNFTQCWQQITVFVDDLTNWATAMESNNTVLQINATTVLADQIYSVLPACGLEHLEEQISQQIPENCVNNLGTAASLGYQCYQVKSQPVKFAKCMPRVTIAVSKAKSSCPFLNNSTNTTY